MVCATLWLLLQIWLLKCDCFKQGPTQVSVCCLVHVQIMYRLTVAISRPFAALCAQTTCKVKGTMHSSTLIGYGLHCDSKDLSWCNLYLAAQQVAYTVMLKLSAAENQDGEHG